jgi:adenylate cyclase
MISSSAASARSGIAMRSSLKGLRLGLLVGILGAVLGATPLGYELEENYGLGWLFSVRGPKAAPPEVVVIALDRKAAEELGLSGMPREWPRALHAELTETLAQAGAAVIVFDLMFDRGSADADHDARLAAALERARNVVLVDSLSREALSLAEGLNTPVGGLSIESQIPPIPILAAAAAAHAPFPLPKAMRVSEYWTFKPGAGEAPTMPVVAYQIYALQAHQALMSLWDMAGIRRPMDLSATRGEITARRVLPEVMKGLRDALTDDPRLAEQLLRTLESTSADELVPSQKRLVASLLRLYSGEETRYLNFYGPPRAIRTIRYDEALRAGREPGRGGAGPDEFRGKAVFIGFSAATQPEQDRIRDDYHTVFSQADGLNLSGVEIAATAFANLLEDRPVRPVGFLTSHSIVLLWGLGLGMLCRSLRVTAAAALSIAAAGTYLAGVQHRFDTESVWVPLVVPLCIQAPAAFFGALVLHYRAARRERKLIRQVFGYFLPSPVVDRLATNIGPLTSANQTVFGVCLATDAEHYTALAERMDPERLSALMNEYYAVLFGPVDRHGGVVSDVVGDAMLAIWAGSSGQVSLRNRACRAALEIVETTTQFNRCGERPPLPTRIGLHSGQMLLGSVGAAHHYEYRAVGDIVNTATRIEGLGKHLGVRLIVSEDVLHGLDEFLARPLGSFVLAGKSTPVWLFELLGTKSAAENSQIQLCTQFEAALRAYADRPCREAAEAFSRILETFPEDGPARFYLDRCRRFAADPPVGRWDSAVHMENK